jgi:uncharacterized coiled-coil DUF342 family protein
MELFNRIADLIICMWYTLWVKKLQLAPSKRTQEREVYMSTHKPKLIEEFVQQIQEALEQIQEIEETLEEKADRDDVEHWSSELAFKLEEIHEDVINLQNEVAEVKDQVELFQN